MHMQGSPRTMQAAPHYADVVTEVHRFVLDRARVAMAAGVAEVWVDPGIGFGKTLEHNLSLLHHLPELVSAASAIGCAGVAVGTSRKRFLGVLAAPRAGRAGRVGGAGRRFPRHGGGGHDRRGDPGAGARRGRHGAGGPAVWSGGRTTHWAVRVIEPVWGCSRMKGKWAAGIPPRNFTWVMKDHLAISERPGASRPITGGCGARRRSSGCGCKGSGG